METTADYDLGTHLREFCERERRREEALDKEFGQDKINEKGEIVRKAVPDYLLHGVGGIQYLINTLEDRNHAQELQERLCKVNRAFGKREAV